MPAYLAPGVFIEEVSSGVKAIEGVPTSVAGFVGPCGYGPVAGVQSPLTSLADFERRHGDAGPLAFGADGGLTAPNFLWHAARSFFDNGGRRLHVSRVFQRLAGDGPADLETRAPGDPPYADGHARGVLGGLRVAARHPGARGNLCLRMVLKLGGPLPSWDALADGDVVWTGAVGAAPVRRVQDLPLALASRGADGRWRMAGGTPPLTALRLLTLDLETLTPDGRVIASWPGLSPNAGRAAASLTGRFGLDGDLDLPVVLLTDGAADGLALVRSLAAGLDWRMPPAELAAAGNDPGLAWRSRFEGGVAVAARLAGGNDGLLPGAAAFEGRADWATGLQALAAVEDIALVAAPGSSWRALQREAEVAAITDQLIAHAESLRYRFALLDAGEAMSTADVRRQRQRLDSRHAALYYPWVSVTDPATGQPLNLPPSGFVAGICARVDAERGVWKAPANEALRDAIAAERAIGQAEQELLNPEGINCLRVFAGQGLRVWGARTVSADPQWKYVNVQRYLAYLEHSLDRGLGWAAFEPNAPALWARLCQAANDFLYGEWRRGALLGDKPEQAFFVRCDRTTMTQADIDNGRLVALVGVALLKPAEFVIFRLGQQTADAKA
ncbi:MAG: phage tail sheath family protein [Comamonadaceae bacterium]|nr:phage tail sheath family protein [Comamonadaceae bacterium]